MSRVRAILAGKEPSPGFPRSSGQILSYVTCSVDYICGPLRCSSGGNQPPYRVKAKVQKNGNSGKFLQRFLKNINSY